VIALPLLLAALLAAPARAPEARVDRRLFLLGTAVELTVVGADRATALAASERAVRALEAAEARLSTWREDSELARLNHSRVGEPFSLSPALAADLSGAARCAAVTGGAFDPAIAPLVAAWGLRRGGRIPSPAERRAATAASGLAGLELGAHRAVRRRADLALEEGGFGKGAALRDALAALARAPGISRAVLDLGGQIGVAGGRFEVTVADPRQRERAALALAIDHGSLSTSGNSEHGFTVVGRRYGHILDPRTGFPAADFGSVTVWADDPLTADCLSTGLFVLGPERALAWAAAHPGIEVVVLVERGGRLVARATPGLAARLRPRLPGLKLEIWKAAT